MQIVLSVTVILVCLYVAIMYGSVSVAILQLEASTAFMKVTVSALNMWVAIFFCINAGGSLCCNYADGTFCSA